MINFPDTPINGQQHTEGDTTWEYEASRQIWTIVDKPLNSFIIPRDGLGGATDLPQYTNNAAALGDGLVVDDMYKDTAGFIRVVI